MKYDSKFANLDGFSVIRLTIARYLYCSLGDIINVSHLYENDKFEPFFYK